MLFARIILGSAFFAAIGFAGVPGHKVHLNPRDLEEASDPFSQGQQGQQGSQTTDRFLQGQQGSQKKEPIEDEDGKTTGPIEDNPELSQVAAFVLCGPKGNQKKVYYLDSSQSPCNDESKRPNCQCSTKKCGDDYCARGQLCATCTRINSGSANGIIYKNCNQVNNPSASYCLKNDPELSCDCEKLAYNAFPDNELAYDENTGLGSQSVPNSNVPSSDGSVPNSNVPSSDGSVPNSNVPSSDGSVSAAVPSGVPEGGDTGVSDEIASGNTEGSDINDAGGNTGYSQES